MHAPFAESALGHHKIGVAFDGVPIVGKEATPQRIDRLWRTLDVLGEDTVSVREESRNSVRSISDICPIGEGAESRHVERLR